ncbi:MAG: ATPase, partial [Deltaproteobacteria bacterium]|nr:ATPase [Nannocystaceae bacterium]
WSSWAALARAAEGTSGAELAAAVAEARLSAYAEQRPLALDDLQAALAESVPLSVLRAEDVAALRRWASGRARRA